MPIQTRIALCFFTLKFWLLEHLALFGDVAKIKNEIYTKKKSYVQLTLGLLIIKMVVLTVCRLKKKQTAEYSLQIRLTARSSYKNNTKRIAMIGNGAIKRKEKP